MPHPTATFHVPADTTSGNFNYLGKTYYPRIINTLDTMTIDIQSVHVTPREELLAVVEKKVSKLAQYYDRIVKAEVFLKAERDEHKEGKTVEIQLHIPGNTLFATNNADKFEAATEMAVEAIRKQLIKHKEKVLHRN